MRRQAILLPALIVIMTIIAVAVYAPGLHGPFLFDDYANLPTLGATGPVDNWPAFWRYITSGSADPTGRPIALLSFLIDAQDWPAAPLPFKRTNLALHIVNGLVLAWLLGKLGALHRLREPDPSPIVSRVRLAALLAAAIWTLHPLFVSTTLYVVQREAMLSTFFALIGLVAWLHGRTLMSLGQSLGGFIWILLGLAGCTLLSVLSKANGILLPVLALVIEYTLPHVSKAGMPKAYRLTMILLAALPSVAVAAYLGYEGWRGIAHGISSTRPWTLTERLMTQPRVLWNYLALLWLPRPFTSGLFNDQIHASTSLLAPWTTLASLVGLAMLLSLALVLRKRHPPLALAILFFLVGQSIESSTIALELYFEHRNYLPAMLMFWPLALWLCHVSVKQAPSEGVVPASPQQTKADVKHASSAKLLLASIVILGLAGMTNAAADLWGNSQDQALLWAALNPQSSRAQASAAQAEMRAGHPELAAHRLTFALANAPDEVQLALNLLAAQCQMGRVDQPVMKAAKQALLDSRDGGTLLNSWFERAIAQSREPACPEMTADRVEDLLSAALGNPRLTSLPGRLQDLHSLEGQLFLAKSMPDRALAEFDYALDQQVRATTAFQQAALLGNAGYPSLGLEHLSHYESERSHEYHPDAGMPAIHQWVLDRQHYWAKELMRLRNTLESDVAEQTRAKQ